MLRDIPQNAFRQQRLKYGSKGAVGNSLIADLKALVPAGYVMRCQAKDRNATSHAMMSYGPSAGAIDAESPQVQKTKNKKEKEIKVLFTELHHILHARNCIHFLWFPHIPRPQRPLKLHTILIYSLRIFNFYSLVFFV